MNQARPRQKGQQAQGKESSHGVDSWGEKVRLVGGERHLLRSGPTG